MVRRKDTANDEFPELPSVGATILLAGNTGDLIKWDELAERLERSPPPISEDQRVRFLVGLANGKNLSGRQWNQLTGLSVMVGADERAVPITLAHRESIREALALCLKQKEGETLIRNAEANLRGRLVIHPEGDSSRVIARGTRDALIYAITRAARAGNVRQCAREACGDFFFLSGGRGAPPKYCGESCSTAADTEKAAQRMTKIRRKRK